MKPGANDCVYVFDVFWDILCSWCKSLGCEDSIELRACEIENYDPMDIPNGPNGKNHAILLLSCNSSLIYTIDSLQCQILIP